MNRQELVRSAERMVRRGRLEAAIAEYRKVLEQRPDDTRTLNRVGDLYLRISKVDEAVDLFSRAAEHFSDEGFFVKAIAIYKKIIRVDPTRIAVYEHLADLYSRQGLVNDARSQYQVVGDYYHKKGDQRSVISILKKMVELEPENPGTRLKLAEAYQQAGSEEKAGEQYRKIAEQMLEHGSVEDAVKVYSRALEVGPQDPEVVGEAIARFEQQGSTAAAAELREKAEELGIEWAAAAPAEEPVEEPAAEPEAPEAAAEDVLTMPPVEEEETRPATPLPDEVESEPEPALEIELGADAAAAAEPPMDVEIEEVSTDELEIEIGLEDLDAAAEPEPEAPAVVEEEVPPELTPAEKAAELVAEARVLASYGLEGKAIERFEEALAVDPTAVDAYRRILEIHLARDRPDEVLALAARAVEGLGRKSSDWQSLRKLLRESGYGLEGDAITAPAPKAEPVEEAVEEAVEAPVEEPVEEPVEAEEAPAPTPQPQAMSETGLVWLDELTAEQEKAAGAEVVGREQEFFDLAAELEQELLIEEGRIPEQEGPPSDEQTLEEIVAGFRKGVADTLSREDYDTHYDLGIAYREMGLLDEAIGEFQLAAKDPRFLVECCSLLGQSFADKGFEELAIKWYQRGLESNRISEEDRMSLLYELGNLRMVSGHHDDARETFVEIYGINSNYRDVVAKLEELRQDK